MPGHIARIAAGRRDVRPPRPGVPAPEWQFWPPAAVFWPPAWPKRRKIRAFCAALAKANPSGSRPAALAPKKICFFFVVYCQPVLQPCPCAIINRCLTGWTVANGCPCHNGAQKNRPAPEGSAGREFSAGGQNRGKATQVAVCRHIAPASEATKWGASPRPACYGVPGRTLQVCNVRPCAHVTPRRAAAPPSADHGRRNPAWISTPRCPAHRQSGAAGACRWRS